MKDLVYSIIEKAIINHTCLICQDDIYIDDKYYLFCCQQFYHEKCLAEYIGLNMYPKCPICHKWVTKEFKEAFDIIFDKEYKVDYYREKIQHSVKFTQDDSFYNSTSTPSLSSPTIRRPLLSRRNAITPDEIFPLMSRLELPSSGLSPSPPRAPRHLIRQNTSQRIAELYNIIDEYGERRFLEDDIDLPLDVLLDRLRQRNI